MSQNTFTPSTLGIYSPYCLNKMLSLLSVMSKGETQKKILSIYDPENNNCGDGCLESSAMFSTLEIDKCDIYEELKNGKNNVDIKICSILDADEITPTEKKNETKCF